MGCRGCAPRTELVRIVRRSDGVVAWDRRGSAPGRGAYVCSTMECVQEAVRRGRLARALRATVDEPAARKLMKEFTATV